jgi:hypothetical protein
MAGAGKADLLRAISFGLLELWARSLAGSVNLPFPV